MDKLQNIGFYTLNDVRAKTVTERSPLQRCELLLTHRCNFNCPYCRGMKKVDQRDLTMKEALHVVDLWAEHNLKNIRFSGGEPTLWEGLVDLIAHTKTMGAKRIALSTNGSASIRYYLRLIEAGVNDFSISLDSCCSSTGYKMAGHKNIWGTIISNIKTLSEITYVTVGVVLTEDNFREANGIIILASDLGVSDIRVIPAAQVSQKLARLKIDSTLLDKHPILNYRFTNFMNGRGVRGLTFADNAQCPLVLDDMAILNGHHYPCIIYMREHGAFIGKVNDNIREIREQRQEWFKFHNCFIDPICKNNCLDVCIDYNNRVREINTHLTSASTTRR